jgi:hypothetical protein
MMRVGPPMMRVIKFLWIVVSVLVLLVTLYAFDGEPNSDIWIFMTWSMLALSFPAGLTISLVHMVLGAGFSVAIETSRLSLALEWAAYFSLGYIQWFKLSPYLVRKLQNLRSRDTGKRAERCASLQLLQGLRSGARSLCPVRPDRA